MQFEPGERNHLRSTGVLMMDEHGRDVYAGLSLEESEEYHAITRALMDGTFRQPSESAAEGSARRERYQYLANRVHAGVVAVSGSGHERQANASTPKLPR